MGSVLSDVLGNLDFEEIMRIIAQGGSIYDAIGPIIEEIMALVGWVMLLVSIPSLIFNAVLCFFGVRIYRVLLVIESFFIGGSIGGFICMLISSISKASKGQYYDITDSVFLGPFLIGLFIFGTINALLAWFIYKVFMFLMAFNFGFATAYVLVFLLRIGAIVREAFNSMRNGNPAGLMSEIAKGSGGAVFAGLLVGITLGVLICIYTKWIVMGMTAIKGGRKVGQILASLILILHGSFGAYRIGSAVFAILCVAGGFTVQFLMDKKSPCNIDRPKNKYQPMPAGAYAPNGTYGTSGMGGNSYNYGGNSGNGANGYSGDGSILPMTSGGNSGAAPGGYAGADGNPGAAPGGYYGTNPGGYPGADGNSGAAPGGYYGTNPGGYAGADGNSGAAPGGYYGTNPGGYPGTDGGMTDTDEEVTIPYNAEEEQLPREHTLVCTGGQFRGQSFVISGPTAMGRSNTRCQIVFREEGGISRMQCELDIKVNTGALSIVDRESSYGTMVNGVRLEKGVVRYLNVGDVVMFGEGNVFRVEN